MIDPLMTSLKKRINRFFSSAEKNQAPLQIIERNDHAVSRNNLAEPALKVLYRLNKAGYEAYLVGGGVRDSLLGMRPKDFDVATNATPEQVNRLFSNSRLIGRRFKLVHVLFGREVIEVATFRAPHDDSPSNKHASTGDSGMILRDNVYGNKDQDAMRRDFTINALYYNVADFSVHAYAGGWQDMQNRQVRMIGDPETRYREDPVRMIRAIRFACKLDFQIEEGTSAPIKELAHLMEQIPAARMFDEVLKLFTAGKAVATFDMLEHYGLFAQLFPATAKLIKQDEYAAKIVQQALINTDLRLNQGKSVAPYYFYAAMLWPVVNQHFQRLKKDMPPVPAMHKAGQLAIREQVQRTAIPKRCSLPMQEVWDLQLRLQRTNSKKDLHTAQQPRFRAAYDFVLTREQVGEKLQNIGKFWTDFQKTTEFLEAEPRIDERTYSKPRGRRPSRSRSGYRGKSDHHNPNNGSDRG